MSRQIAINNPFRYKLKESLKDLLSYILILTKESFNPQYEYSSKISSANFYIKSISYQFLT